MAWWIWIVLGSVLLIAEVAISADFWIVFFGISAILTGLLLLLGVCPPEWQQWLLFAALAVLMLWFYRGRLKAKLSRADRPMGPELVGEAGLVKTAMAAGARGKVELRGAAWDAYNAGEVDLAEGNRCIVENVDGLTLTVRPE